MEILDNTCNICRLVRASYGRFNCQKHTENCMNEELRKMVAAERKHARELKELRDLQKKLNQQKSPDPKAKQMVQDEINRYLEGTHATAKS